MQPRARPKGRPSLPRAALLIYQKDLTVELRSREVLATMALFGVLLVVLSGFAFVRDAQALPDVAAGVLWVALAFTGTLGVGRTLDREREGDTLRALLQAPMSRNALYLGKLCTVVTFMLLVEAILVPLVGLFFDAPVLARPGMLALLLAFGTVGFASLGSLMAALLLGSRSRDLILAVIVYPLCVPVLVGGVLGTSALWQPVPNDGLARMWLAVVAACDILFLTLALLVFEPLMTE